MEKKKVVVEIFGEVYPLKSDEPADYVRQLAKLVDDNMRDVAKKTRSFSGTKIGVLAALQLADEYCKLKKDYDELLALLEEPKG
ncbi:cell division protein ZapA [uncultured Selenomonas sp.]|uniref:cell division protein ZapA n=1 Tax=uncultured Selenomonas sp. TaxID=159275 RepID=UPI0026304C5E|nr:cell division protein ZapA [uncultured Selenomonas sp.]